MTPWRYLVLEIGGEPYALVRTHQGIIERWQPVSRQWINAAFNADQVYGEDWRESRAITIDDAEALQASGEGLFELSDEALKKLR